MIALPARLRRLSVLGSKFLLVGGLSTLIEIVVFNLCIFAFGLDLVTSKVIASLVALVNAYFGNRQWVFRAQASRGRLSELGYFLLVNLFCLLLGAGLVWLGAEVFEMMFGRAAGAFALNFINLASIAVVVVVRFVLYHKLVFRKAPGSGDATSG